MSPQTTKSNSTNHSRCRQSTVDGRRCRLAASDARSGLCFRHRGLSQSHSSTPSSTPTATLDPEVLAAELLGEIENFTTADAVNLFLGNLVKQLARKRIARRDAIALAYLGQLLLNSLTPLRKEKEEDYEQDIAAGQEFLNNIARAQAARLAEQQSSESPEPESKIHYNAGARPHEACGAAPIKG